MLSFYDSRSLAKKLHIPLARYKRWSREFLPPDNLGGFQSGYARQYNLNEAFRVYLGGFLVHETKLAVSQANDILRRLQSRLPNMYGVLKPEELQGLRLGVILDDQNQPLLQLQNGARVIMEDEEFQEEIGEFVRVVLVGKLILKFAHDLDA